MKVLSIHNLDLSYRLHTQYLIASAAPSLLKMYRIHLDYTFVSIVSIIETIRSSTKPKNHGAVVFIADTVTGKNAGR